MKQSMQRAPNARSMYGTTLPITRLRTANCGKFAQGGFSLIEMMVGITLALFLAFGLAVLFANTSTERREVDKASRQIEAGRYALQVLSDEVRHAGYYGRLTNAPTLPVSVTTLPDPCSTTLSVVQNGLGLPLQGYAGAASAATLDPGNVGCLNAAAGYRANTAVLVVRRANTSNSACASGSGLYCIQVSGCKGDSVPYVLDAANAGAGIFNLHSNGSPGCLPLSAAPAAAVTPFYLRMFFVSTCSGTDCSAAGADTTPTLKRINVTPGGATITPIVDGIENLQFVYGIDTTGPPGDGAPDVFTSAPLNMTQWQNVMTLRIHLLARNVDQTAGYVDPKVYVLGPVSYTPTETGFRRHAYSEVVRLDNPAGRRE